eukprot:TRINITY_DN46326_c0_g1_i1.p1 TRINITY_DN46326_c0_g1~~TRINITY_DN46326_c0_g1_i1.p1  ORF type:complete len:187 (-),score=52.14 TRINITY_DN46326_c0_g1_i1:212-772(-)
MFLAPRALRPAGRLTAGVLQRHAARQSLPQLAVLSRGFASGNPLEATAKLYEDLVEKSVKEYQANQKAVSDDLDAELAKNRLVLFMEGTPDAPLSEVSLNVVKMLTQGQVVPLLAIDVLKHPALLGYTVSKSGRRRVPHLYVNGSFYADYEGLLAKYSSGELAKTFGTEATKSTGTFGGELPIATY